MNDFSEKDRQLLNQFGLTEEQVGRDVARMEDESADHGVVGPVHYGSHMLPNHDERTAGAPARRRKAS